MKNITEPIAVNKGKPWTQKEDCIVKDVKTPLLLVAIKTGRTYSSVLKRAQAIGAKRIRTIENSTENWIVIFDKIGVEEAMKAEMEGRITVKGIPIDESFWEWVE